MANARHTMNFAVMVPVETVSESNVRGHWSKRAKRAKVQRKASWASLAHAHGLRGVVPCVVKLVRVSPRELDDDNLRGALKACRDGVADWLGVDDRDARVVWEYGQEKGAKCVRIEVRES